MALITCPHCGNKISSEAERCVHCGSQFSICPECGAVFEGIVSVCPSCGYTIKKPVANTQPAAAPYAAAQPVAAQYPNAQNTAVQYPSAQPAAPYAPYPAAPYPAAQPQPLNAQAGYAEQRNFFEEWKAASPQNAQSSTTVKTLKTCLTVGDVLVMAVPILLLILLYVDSSFKIGNSTLYVILYISMFLSTLCDIGSELCQVYAYKNNLKVAEWLPSYMPDRKPLLKYYIDSGKTDDSNCDYLAASVALQSNPEYRRTQSTYMVFTAITSVLCKILWFVFFIWVIKTMLSYDFSSISEAAKNMLNFPLLMAVFVILAIITIIIYILKVVNKSKLNKISISCVDEYLK